MIIQCEQCNTKFKLDDSKIKPEGVKVKCKKCGNIFFVFPQPVEKEENIIFDDVNKAKENDFFQAGIFETPFTSSPEKTEEKVSEKIEEEIGKIDLSGFNIEDTFKESEKPYKGEEEETFDEFSQVFGQQESEDGILKEDSQNIPFSEEKKEEFEFTGDLNLENTVKIDEGLFEEEKREEVAFEDLTEQQVSQISSNIQDFDDKTKKVELSEPEQQNLQELSLDGGFIFEPDENHVTEDDIENKEEIKIPEDITDIGGNIEGSERIDDKVEELQQKPITEDFLAQAPKKLSILEFLVAILIVIVIGGGGVGYMWWQRVQMSEKIGNIGILNVKASFVDNKQIDKIFVVTGKIKNGFNVPKSFIKVKCVLLDKNNKKVGEKVVFAGNTFTEAEIKELSYEEIEKGLNNKMGKSMVNVDVPPGKVIDFMIVFDKLPEDAVTLEVEGV